MPAPPQDAKAILLITSSPNATKRILQDKIVMFRSPVKSWTFYIQSHKSWNSHIIADIRGGGLNFERDVLPHVWITFESYIQLATGKKQRNSEVHLANFSYAKVVQSEKTHEGSNVVVWRIKFKYSACAMNRDWNLPCRIGKSNRGDLTCNKALFCSQCVSYSHAQNTCEWWKEGLVAGKKTKPLNHVKMDCKKLPSVNPKKLAREAEWAPLLFFLLLHCAPPPEYMYLAPQRT